jgi:hypothetical protein
MAQELIKAITHCNFHSAYHRQNEQGKVYEQGAGFYFLIEQGFLFMQNQEKEEGQTLYQDDIKGADINRNDQNAGKWGVEELSDEASQKDFDEFQRQIKRGDETEGDPDKRDEAGSVDSNETPQGREEAKNDVEGKANVNG